MLRKTRAVLLPSRAAAAAERRSRLPILFLERCDFPAGRDFSKKNLLHVSYYQHLKRIKVMRNRSFTMVTGSERDGVNQDENFGDAVFSDGPPDWETQGKIAVEWLPNNAVFQLVLHLEVTENT